MNLTADLQRSFQQAILASDLSPGLLLREDRQDGGGLDIYVNAYRARLIVALKDNYPMLRLALGDEGFDDLALAYLNQHPSRHRSIRWFGDELRTFIDAHPDAIPHPALADLASMDWALRCGFDAADAPPRRGDELEALAPDEWPRLRFILHPSVTLIDLNWQVEPIWHVLNENPDAETEAPEALNHTLLVWRHELECHWRSLEATEALALRAVAAGKAFAEVCEIITSHSEENPNASDPALVAASMLRQWLDHGLLVRR